jgi:glycosyltransferase involved in cell wall biosynthesis
VGGAELQQCLLARGLVRRGYKVSMICADHGQPQSTTVDGIHVERLPGRGGLPGVRFFHPFLTGLWSALSRVDADIYYQRAAGVTTGIVALFARRHGRDFVYAAAHDLDVTKSRTHELFRRRAGWRDRQLFTLGLKLADAIVVQHTIQAAECERGYGRLPIVVPSCYAAPPGAHSDPGGVVLWVSTLRDWKRPELFLELARRLPGLRFRMVGGPGAEAGGQELFDRIQADARAIGNLEFVGFVPQAASEAHFNAARVFVNTSVNEGFPNTFLQAWSRAIPTVSFCQTGSMLDGQSVGRVARDLDEMTTQVADLMERDVRWMEAGQRARDYVERYHTVEGAVSAYERLFDSFDNRGAVAAQARRASAF